MRSRTVREGSVGLLILLGLAMFGGLVLWLRGFSIGKRSYTAVLEFPNVGGMQVGAAVRYRGVSVGKITDIKPNPNGVDVSVEIASADVVIPRDGLAIETNQSSLIGETYIDMRPQKLLPAGVNIAKPIDRNCNPDLIVCNKSRLQGQVGVSFDELLRSTVRVANLYSDPNLYANLSALTRNGAVAAAGVTQLTRDLSGLTRTVQQEAKNFSAAANSVTRAANQTSYQAGLAANQFGNTANQFSLTAQQLNQLVGTVNNLVVTNRSTLVTTLNNFSEASDQLRVAAGSLKPTLTQVNSTLNQFNSTANRFNSAELARNLETLSTNAAKASANAVQASANLRDLSAGLNKLNTPQNLVQLQRTLDSAQAVFENANKITSELDRLTGNPAFVDNVEKLVNGLAKLVSSTQQLEQQVQVARALAPVSATINTPVPRSEVFSRPLFSSVTTKAEVFPRSLIGVKYPCGQLWMSPGDSCTDASPVLTSKAEVFPRSQNFTAQTPILTQAPTRGKSIFMSGDRDKKLLKPLPQPSASPSIEEWFVPDDQPESEN